MNHWIQLRIVPVSERRISFGWSVRTKPLVQLRANSASFLQIMASGHAHHNRLIREFGQTWRPTLHERCRTDIKPENSLLPMMLGRDRVAAAGTADANASDVATDGDPLHVARLAR